MNKKQHRSSSFMHVCIPLVMPYIDGLNTCRTVSKGFVPLCVTKSITVTKKDLTARKMAAFLSQKNRLLKKLDLSDCENLNIRTLITLLEHFKDLSFLILDNCHSLVSLSYIPQNITVSESNLWRPYVNHRKLAPETVLRVITNAYNYMAQCCPCHCRQGKVALNKLKSFCNVLDASYIVFALDTLLYRIAPVDFCIENTRSRNENEIVYDLVFYSFYGQVRTTWNMSKDRDMWCLSEVWAI